MLIKNFFDIKYMARYAIYYNAILEILNKNNGLTSKEIYQNVQKRLKPKAEHWKRRVRLALNNKTFVNRNGKWYLK